MREAADLITSFSALLSAMLWPGLLMFAILRFHEPIVSFLGDLGQFSFKAPGIEASVSRRQMEVAAAMGAAVAKRAEAGGSGDADAGAVVNTVLAAIPDQRAQRSLSRSRILWVDDHPENNTYEREALLRLGIAIRITTSTSDALKMLEQEDFDLVISDMGRPPDSRAGYTLLDSMRLRGDTTEVVFYAGSNSRRHQEEARNHGAIGSTNSPRELMDLVTQHLRG